MKKKNVIKNSKKFLVKFFKPNSEKIFVAMTPFIVVVPVLLYIISDFIYAGGGSLANFFKLTGFFAYTFISLFAIPFEGFLEFMGMMDFGGGIFDVGIKGINLFGILFVQSIYSMIFYTICSLTSFMRKGKTMKYSLGRRNL